MKAAVVSSFDIAPRYAEFPAPTPARDDDMVMDVIAAGLHPRVRSQANGSHYTSTGELPLVPGIDGVGRGGDGLLRYFVLPDTRMGAMAEQTVIDTRRSVILPGDADPITVAAAMNPAMSSWVALRQRVAFQAGQNLLVLGPPGTLARWPCRSRSVSARIRSSRPGATPAGWLACPPSAPPLPCCSTRTLTTSPTGSARPPPTLTS
jgi:NADPH:quinone reductase-like Zn-dependent oxidoreductase